MQAVVLKDISKAFDGQPANHRVSLNIPEGTIHAIVGENGAGKSTLMNILYGMYTPDSGEIFIRGRKHSFSSPADSLRVGIGMVHQHFMLVSPLTVMENIILGSEPVNRFQFVDLNRAERQVREIALTYKLDVDPMARIESLSVGMQQRVEILKTLYRNVDILILDEPTPLLAPQEIKDLFSILLSLKDQGKTVILITHKLREVMDICDSVTIMRRGEVVGERLISQSSEVELARLMVGRDIQPMLPRSQTAQTEDVLELKNVSTPPSPGSPGLNDVSLSVRAGEIVGIAGVEGNGQAELIKIVTGATTLSAGSALICGIPVTRSITISHIPDDRIKQGIILNFSVAENFILGRQHETRFFGNGLSNVCAIDEFADEMIEHYGIRIQNKSQEIRTLSGGNQQKVVVAREVSKHVPLLIAHQPTRGLDIGAIEFVRNTLIKERNARKAILLIGSDLDELMMLSDRIIVFYAHGVAATVRPNETTIEALGLSMTGALRKTG